MVFGKDVAGIKQIAVDAAKMIMDMSAKARRRLSLRIFAGKLYRHRAGSGAEICNAVIAEVKPTAENKLILNLPSTVEMATPKSMPDQIEWMCRNIDNRERT